MVIQTKYSALAFLFLVIFSVLITKYFDTTINEKENQYLQTVKKQQEFHNLQSRFDKKAQKKELKRIYDFLDLFDIKYTIKSVQKHKELSMVLKKHNMDKIISFILDRNIPIKSFELKTKDKYSALFKVVL